MSRREQLGGCHKRQMKYGKLKSVAQCGLKQDRPGGNAALNLHE